MLKGQDAGDQFDRAAASSKVAKVALGRYHGHRRGALPKNLSDRPGLIGVRSPRRQAVGVDMSHVAGGPTGCTHRLI